MSSVQETKDDLARQIETTQKVSETAITAIDTLLNLSTWVLTVFGLLLAVLAIAGVYVIARQARKSARAIANDRLNDYLKSDEFAELMGTKVQQAIDAKWQSTMVVQTFRPAEAGVSAPSDFPRPKRNPTQEADDDSK